MKEDFQLYETDIQFLLEMAGLQPTKQGEAIEHNIQNCSLLVHRFLREPKT